MKKRILIVEDDRAIQESLRSLLAEEGFDSISAFNGQEATTYLESLNKNELPDLILLDLMMPIKDGFSFRLEQRDDPKISHIPVVIMTATSETKEVQKLLEIETLIKKPFDMETILKAVYHHCPISSVA
ncbi:MAG: response regulator [Deltaproteobacteria bacterium]|nr:response regulator [Deltaproteobacteria bacterium]